MKKLVAIAVVGVVLALVGCVPRVPVPRFTSFRAPPRVVTPPQRVNLPAIPVPSSPVGRHVVENVPDFVGVSKVPAKNGLPRAGPRDQAAPAAGQGSPIHPPHLHLHLPGHRDDRDGDGRLPAPKGFPGGIPAPKP
jgi:hypothetical protein